MPVACNNLDQDDWHILHGSVDRPEGLILFGAAKRTRGGIRTSKQPLACVHRADKHKQCRCIGALGWSSA